MAIQSGGELGASHWHELGGKIGFFDLSTGNLNRVYEFSQAMSPPPRPGMSFASDGLFYVFMPTGRNDVSPFVIDPETGEGELKSSTIIGYPRIFHPDQERFFTFTDNGADVVIREYTFNNGDPDLLASNTIQSGDLCDDRWISSDGTRILDRCGNYIALSGTNENLTLVKNHIDLDGEPVSGLDARAADNLIVVTYDWENAEGNTVEYFDYQTGESLGQQILESNETWVPMHVYMSPNSSAMRIVARNAPLFSSITAALTIYPSFGN